MSRYQVPKPVAVKARLVEAAMALGRGKNLSSGMDAAQSYLKRSEANTYSTRKWIVDREITAMGGKRILVAVNKSKREVAINIAGTKLAYDPHGIDDIALDVQMINGSEVDSHQQLTEGQTVVRAVKRKYPGYLVEINGFSLGGGKAIHLGNVTGLSSFTFNPHTISRWLLDSTPSAGVTHNIYRTYNDFPSRGGYYLMNKHPDNYAVHAYNHLRINDTPSDKWDIYSVYNGLEKPHRLDNFYLYRARVGGASPRGGVDVTPVFHKRKPRSRSRKIRTRGSRKASRRRSRKR